MSYRATRGATGLILCLGFAPALALLPACVTEVDAGPMIELPASVVRFIEEPTRIEADAVLIQAASQFRAEIAPVVDRDAHVKIVTSDRIRLENRGQPLLSPPVSLTFRNLHVKARHHIEVRFSDKSLLESEVDQAVAILVVADGIAYMEGPGYELTAPKIVIANDRVRALGEDDKPWPLPAALR